MPNLNGLILEHILFTLQNRVMRKHISEFKKQYDFISACIEHAGDLKITEQSWKAVPFPRVKVFNDFHGDVLSTLINAIRLVLQGCATDAYALMRVVRENLTILQYIVKFTLYKPYFVYVKWVQRGKRFGDQFSYQTAVRKLDIEDQLGEFSKLGSHASPPRHARGRFKVGDSYFPMVGASVNNPMTKEAMDKLASLALSLVEVTDDFITACLKEAGKPYHHRRIELKTLYENLQEE